MSQLKAIPLYRLDLAGNEIRYMEQALECGKISGDGPFTRSCEALLERQLGASKVLLATSCTQALEMAAFLLNIRSGDEVIVPSFTFPSTANAFVVRGATPVFADVRPDTLNLDETRLEPLITPATKAIVVVHYAGIPCEMEAILKIGARYNIPVIEDNALGLYGKYRGRFLGTLGSIGCLSFHQTKSFVCGEGGAVCLNDSAFCNRAEILREKGTNRRKFARGEVDKYTWVDVGSSYVPSDLLAAFLYAQLESCSDTLSRRRRVWDYYKHELSAWAVESGAKLPYVPPGCEPAYSMFHLLLPSAKVLDGLLQRLNRSNIGATFHYQPLHLSPMAQSFGARPGDCPVAEDISGRLLRLPFFPSLSQGEQAEVVRVVEAFRPARAVSGMARVGRA
jgi:dTDP-4-amino-4,6-dideoxygalactose transaminase